MLDYDSFCKFVSKSDVILSTLSSELEITKELAMQQAQNFFIDKNIIVQAQGAIYKIGSYFQSAGSAGFLANTLALPMKGVEIMWNSYENLLIQKVFGIPLILNMSYLT